MKRLMAVLFVLFISVSLWAQDIPADSTNLLEGAPKIFLDCNACDKDFIRTEIPFVNYVRDRHDAEVHVLVTSQSTGSGGREYSFLFLGQGKYAGMNDTLSYISGKTDTNDDKRKGMTELLKLGLIRYVAKTPIAKEISLKYNRPKKKEEVKDNWNYWVYGLSANTFASGQESSNSLSVFGNIYANRITPDWKIRLKVRGSYNENNFDISGTTYTSISRSKGASATIIRSLNDHWSAGLFGNFSQSTYQNIDQKYNLYGAVEYNVFPYSESTRKELRIEYGVGETYADYTEKTIYLKTTEMLTRHHLGLTLSVTQPWGTVNTSIDARQYLHDLSKNQVSLSTYLNFRIISGLSLHLMGSISYIHDQLSLSAGGASQEEILLQRKELATTYSYFTSFGFSYTFGSIYNNIVNSRFGSGGGGGYSISFSN